MEQKEGASSQDGTTVSPSAEAPGAAEEESNGTTGPTVREGPPDGAGKEGKATAEDSASVEPQGDAIGLAGGQAASHGEAGQGEEAEAHLRREDGREEEATGASREVTAGKEEARSEGKEAEDKKEATLTSEKQKAAGEEAKKAGVSDKDQPAPPEAAGEEAAEKEAKTGGEEAHISDKDKSEPREAAGEEADKKEAKTGGEEAHISDKDKSEPREAAGEEADEKEAKTGGEEAHISDKDKSEPLEAAGEEAAKKEAKTEAQQEAGAEPQKADGKEEATSDAKEPGESTEEQVQDQEKESEEGAALAPSSPEEWPESPTEEGPGLSPDGLAPDGATSGETSPSASESSPSDAPQSPTESPPSGEKKEKAAERRVSAPARPRGPRAQNRKAIVDKFGGAASGPTALFRNTKAAGVAIGGVKNMLLEWCRAMTRNYEHVDIQNFSSSWSSGMAFCALIHKFFPDAFDYAALDPTKRRHNFTLAFSTAEKLADCAQLLEVDDMVRMAVPDSKCVYTYIQELYRSLVEKGLVKTKKK